MGGGTAVARRRGIWTLAIVILLVLMGLGTKVVGSNSAAGAAPGAFSAADYATKTFPKVQQLIKSKAADAPTLAAAIAADPAAAAQKYGSTTSGQPVFAVKFTGTVGQGTSGIYPVTVPGVPAGLLIRIQTGPAINGTDVRDATGTITFSQFTNQIDYQNAGAALNDQVKQKVLSKVDTASLTGKPVSVVGAFTLINPNAWLVTPVSLDVQ
jgi:predicted lipoprotein